MKNVTMSTVNNIIELFNSIENPKARLITANSFKIIEVALTIDEIIDLMCHDTKFKNVDYNMSIGDFVIIYRREIIETFKTALVLQNIVIGNNLEVVIGNKIKNSCDISHFRKVYFYITEIKD